MKPLRIALLSLVALPVSMLAQEQAYDGTPVFSSSRPIAYYVWRAGGSWHVRWTSLQRSRNFNGSVTARDGTLSALVKVDAEKELTLVPPNSAKLPFTVTRERSTVRMPDSPPPASEKAISRALIDMDGTNRIAFSSQIDGGINGFDFVADDNVSDLTFVLEVDEKPQAGSVLIGKKGKKPAALPLVIALK